MWLPWSALSLCLILILSLLAKGDYECLQNELCEELIMDNHGQSVNLSCIVDQRNRLNISWDASDFQGKAQYSICYLFCTEKSNENKRVDVEGPVYHTLIPNQTYWIFLQLNVSYPDCWNIQIRGWDICEVEKLDPPQITNASILSDRIYLKWNLPKSKKTINADCFLYDLRINNEVRSIKGNLNYTEENVDPTQRYRIQMRVKISSQCCDALFWSDWTSVLDVGSSAKLLTDFNIGIIIAKSLGLPMILLALLLLCKYQRVINKLFPPIPGPSIQITGLLEKDITSQVISHKCVEEITEVEVKEDESEEEEEEN